METIINIIQSWKLWIISIVDEQASRKLTLVIIRSSVVRLKLCVKFNYSLTKNYFLNCYGGGVALTVYRFIRGVRPESNRNRGGKGVRWGGLSHNFHYDYFVTTYSSCNGIDGRCVQQKMCCRIRLGTLWYWVPRFLSSDKHLDLSIISHLSKQVQRQYAL